MGVTEAARKITITLGTCPPKNYPKAYEIKNSFEDVKVQNCRQIFEQSAGCFHASIWCVSLVSEMTYVGEIPNYPPFSFLSAPLLSKDSSIIIISVYIVSSGLVLRWLEHHTSLFSDVIGWLSTQKHDPILGSSRLNFTNEMRRWSSKHCSSEIAIHLSAHLELSGMSVKRVFLYFHLPFSVLTLSRDLFFWFVSGLI